MASSSALSLPGSPQWAGTYCRWTCLPPEAEVSRRQIAAPSADFWAPAPVASVASAACESVQRISGVSSRSSPSCCTSSSAARIATSSARVLLHTEPAGVRIFFSSPDGRVIRAPPPPAETPPSAEPSLHIQMARSGRVARCRSAAARLTSSWAVRRTSASTSIRIVTRGFSVHGGRVMWSLSSTRVSGTPARAAAPLPASRQPVVVRRRRGAVFVATARRGSSSLCDAAVHASLAASTSLRVRTGDHPRLCHQRVSWRADRAAGHDTCRGTHLPLEELHMRLRRRREPRRCRILKRAAHVAVGDGPQLWLPQTPRSRGQLAQLGDSWLGLPTEPGAVLPEMQLPVERHSEQA